MYIWKQMTWRWQIHVEIKMWLTFQIITEIATDNVYCYCLILAPWLIIISWSMRGSITYTSKICLFGIFIILCWLFLRNKRFKKTKPLNIPPTCLNVFDFSVCSPKQVLPKGIQVENHAYRNVVSSMN